MFQSDHCLISYHLSKNLLYCISNIISSRQSNSISRAFLDKIAAGQEIPNDKEVFINLVAFLAIGCSVLFTLIAGLKNRMTCGG